MRQQNRVGGGAQTNANGLRFERLVELKEIINRHPDYEVFDNKVFRDGNEIAQIFQKNALYKNLLEPRGVNYRDIVSKRLLPDGSILVGNTLYVIEVKYQAAPGSVDEKLQTCDFKKKQYAKLLAPLSIRVEYYYILNEWFRQDSYRDVRNYILSVGCKFFFDVLPLEEIGL